MKKILILLFLFTAINSYSQAVYDSISNTVSSEAIFEVPKKTKKEIYLKTKEWIAINFKDIDNVLKLDSEGKIIIKAILNSSYTINGSLVDLPLNYTLTFSIKDYKYKLNYDSYYYYSPSLNISVPVSKYITSNKNDLLKAYQEQLDKTSDWLVRSSIKRMMKGRTFEKNYKQSLEVSNRLINDISKDINETNKSLFDFINAKDDW